MTLEEVKRKCTWDSFVRYAIENGADVDWWEDKRPCEDVMYVRYKSATFFQDGSVEINASHLPVNDMWEIFKILKGEK